MSHYTKNGDRGTTDLFRAKNVSKSDDRIGLIGTIEELSGHLGLLSIMLQDPVTLERLEQIQQSLQKVSAGVSDPYSKDFRITEEPVTQLEEEMARLDGLYTEPEEDHLPKRTRLSAEIEIARAVARRAERAYALVGVRFGGDHGAKKFLNRLSDYLCTLARCMERKAKVAGYSGSRPEERQETAWPGTASQTAAWQETDVYPGTASQTTACHGTAPQTCREEELIRRVLAEMGITGKITLDSAKKLIEKIEEEALRRGKKAVIAVCGPDGNPIAVHVMDGALLISFDVAIKKAYTSAALKMPTIDLKQLVMPGGTFYGLDKTESGKIVLFGGGVPLQAGDTIIGALGVSGGTGEEDHALAQYGLSILPEII